ncbi:hypothetical protein ACVKXF_000831 [Curtobacterium sp. PvP017]
MELGWVTAIVTTLVGGIVTLATLWRTTAMAAKRDKDAADREDARRREDHARERRSLERDAVMRLVARYQSTHTYARTFTPRLIAERIDTIEHGSFVDAVEIRTFEDGFDRWWQRREDPLGLDVELITDADVRSAVRTCEDLIAEAIGVSHEAYTADAQILVVRCSYLAFEILSAWLREEPMSAKHVTDAANFAKVLQSYYDSFDQPDQ